MPTFQDSENIPPMVPEGDYIYSVKAFEISISQTTATRGAEKYDLDIVLEPSVKPIHEVLIDHPKTGWKIDCFLKSAGVTLAKGESFEFRKDVAEKHGVKWIDPVGLRGWCHVIQDTLPARNETDAAAIRAGTKTPLTMNKIAIFYTDKAKLPRAVVEVPEDEKPF